MAQEKMSLEKREAENERKEKQEKRKGRAQQQLLRRRRYKANNEKKVFIDVRHMYFSDDPVKKAIEQKNFRREKNQKKIM